jgi:tryptophan synthase alpha chain
MSASECESGWWAAHSLLVCYAPLGDPACPANLLEIYARGGVDIVEAGVPTADPYLDGLTVADSMRRAAAHGAHAIPRLIEQYAASRQRRCHVVLMGYADLPFVHYTRAARSGIVDGLLMVEGRGFVEPPGLSTWLAENRVARAGFVDAGLSDDAVTRARHAAGYVMLQATAGPTGVRHTLDPANAGKITALRRAGVRLPIVLGFGIGTAEHAAAAIALGADGVVVGSACIDAARGGERALAAFIASLRDAIDAAAARRAAANGG